MPNTDAQYELLPEVTQFINQDLKLFINGKWTNSAAPKTADIAQPIIDPSTQNTICQTLKASPEDVDEAVGAARMAFDDGRWRNMPAAQRGDILLKISQLITKHARELAELETLNAGKLFIDSLHGEIPAAAAAFRYYAEQTEKIAHEKFTPSVKGVKLSGYIRREPIGVVGLIVPWNGPLVMAAWKLAPALASGCNCILKPAELTPLTALRLGQLMQEAGVPDGVVNIITGAGSKIGAYLAAHGDIDKIAFTGSTETGRSLLTAAQGNFKKLSLELGGKSPVLIFADADIDAAIEGAAQGIFANAGQVCVAGARLLVQESVYQQVIDGIQAIAENMKHGSPFAPDTNIGPLISEVQRQNVHKFVERAQAEGGQLLTGGSAFAGDGFFYKPTIFTDITPDMTLYREEVFGPVLSVTKFADFDDALTKANDNKYGLASSVWTQDPKIAETMAHTIRAGIVWINCHGIPDITMPIGGYRQSGWGRELGAQGMDIYMESKSIMTRH